ncbi:hypothetical protein BJX68DRAFT_251375 [Aspergillus pseudodeflectus]|uniref:Uncharacterized protein n=1 Tax=Aspergillus pseudodeflectus TaxID=176178 RepID=A0ABR4J6L3_9EURO
MALETPLHENKKKGAPSRKAFHKLYEADIYLGIQLRGSSWSSFESQLEKYYPILIQKTTEDILQSRNSQQGR